MPRLEEAEYAFQRAHEAGDTEAARTLAGEVYRLRENRKQAREMSAQSYSPTEGMSGTEKFLAGAGKAYTDMWRGAKQIAGEVLPGEQPWEAGLQTEIDESRRLDQPLMQTGAGMTGNIAGNVAMTLPVGWVPGAATYKGAAAIGTALGGAQPVSSDESRLANAMMGGGGGVAGRALVGGAGRILNPQTRKEVIKLMKEGVTPTPGKILGKGFERAEEGVRSIPLAGDFVISQQNRAIHEFNTAALNRVLKPLGRSTARIGREGVEEAGEIVSQAYDDALLGVSTTVDDGFKAAVRDIADEAKRLAEPQFKKFSNVMKHDVMNRVRREVPKRAGGKFIQTYDPNQPGAWGEVMELDGRTAKSIMSDLGHKARQFMRSTDDDDRELGRIIYKIKQTFSDLNRRQNPTSAEMLDAADEAYRQLLVVEKASSYAGSKNGIFTAAGLRNASKATDTSFGKRSFARGRATMQDLADTAETVLAPKVADSGTPFRMIQAGATGAAGYLIDPNIAIGLVGTGGLYNPVGNRLAASLLTRRPDLVRTASQRLISPLQPYAAAGLGASAPSIASALREQGNQ